MSEGLDDDDVDALMRPGKHILNSSAQTQAPTSNATPNANTASIALTRPVLTPPSMAFEIPPMTSTIMTSSPTLPPPLSLFFVEPPPTDPHNYFFHRNNNSNSNNNNSSSSSSDEQHPLLEFSRNGGGVSIFKAPSSICPHEAGRRGRVFSGEEVAVEPTSSRVFRKDSGGWKKGKGF